MSSLRVTTVLLPPAKGRSIDGDSRRPTSRGMLREVGRRIKTGENSRPTIGENSTAAHTGEGLRFGKVGELAEESQLAGVEGILQFPQEQPAE